MELRCYQSAAVDAVIGRFDAGDQRTLVVLPTGGGKTIVAGHVARRLLAGGGRVMVVAHRDELVRQAADKFAAVTGIMPAIEKADDRSLEEGIHGPPRIVVSSVQTQVSGRAGAERMRRFHPGDFALLWVDEAHHAPAETWRRVIDYYGQNLGCKVLGVTATADRADGEELGQVFQSVAYRYELPDIIEDGYLVPIRQSRVRIDGLDFSRCRTTAGDLNQGDLEAAMLAEKPFHGVAHATIETACGLPRDSMTGIRDDEDRTARLEELIGARGRRRKTLVFTVGIAQAERMAEVFNRWIPQSAASIDGTMTTELRRKTLRWFKDGKIQFLVNCMVCTEGFDEPGVELVAVARPTKSRALYAQMVGRGTRPAESIAGLLGSLPDAAARRVSIADSGKPCLEVLDFVGNSGRHKLVTTIDLLGCEYDPAALAMAEAMAADGMVDVTEALELSQDELERRRREAEAKRRKAEEEAERRRREEAAKRAKLVGTGQYHLEQRDPFDQYSASVDRVTLSNPPGVPAHQLNVIRKFKVPEADIAALTPTAAAYLSRELVRHVKAGLCTYKQAKCLKRAGYTRAELHDMTFEAASEAITAVKANGWRRPAEPVGGAT